MTFADFTSSIAFPAFYTETGNSYQLSISTGATIGGNPGGPVFPTTTSAILTFERTDGQPFTLVSMDIDTLSGNSESPSNVNIALVVVGKTGPPGFPPIVAPVEIDSW